MEEAEADCGGREARGGYYHRQEAATVLREKENNKQKQREPLEKTRQLEHG